MCAGVHCTKGVLALPNFNSNFKFFASVIALWFSSGLWLSLNSATSFSSITRLLNLFSFSSDADHSSSSAPSLRHGAVLCYCIPLLYHIFCHGLLPYCYIQKPSLVFYQHASSLIHLIGSPPATPLAKVAVQRVYDEIVGKNRIETQRMLLGLKFGAPQECWARTCQLPRCGDGFGLEGTPED